MRSFCLLLLLCGCAATPRIEPARYDIVPVSPMAAQSANPALSLIEVRSPSWLVSPAMQYRLAYAPGAGRGAYADSRWVAPPAELLERALTRTLLAGPVRQPAGGCRLILELDELIQLFDAPRASHVLLAVRASLRAPRGNILLAGRAFTRQAPAGADAQSAVAAYGMATSLLADDLGGWLNDLATASPGIALSCRGG